MYEEGRSPSRGTAGSVEHIPGKVKEIGEGFTIRRYLPAEARRMIGAWCFLDHAGPVVYEAGQGLHVGPHPHIGLQTFTWMIRGELVHRDSLGYEQIIRPGQVNLMTAGRGIVHAEDAVSDEAGSLHAAQLWIALPEAERRREPDFHHYPDLPRMEKDGFHLTVLAGTVFGETAPAQLYSPLVGVDIQLAERGALRLPLQRTFEHGIVVVEGELTIEGQALSPGTLLCFGPGCDRLTITGSGPAHALVLGGEPFRESIALWWNFVARTREELIEAAKQWQSGAGFASVQGSPTAPLLVPSLETLVAD